MTKEKNNKYDFFKNKTIYETVPEDNKLCNKKYQCEIQT